ncbi:MAG TPA: DUF1501 domain-containing protein [Gemmataceae bacterium]|nr:DUF1501 domain-containing protein [Gemmataceae bacterium]
MLSLAKISRRDFLRVGGITTGSAGLSLANIAQGRAGLGTTEKNFILLFLVGGPSQLDTWDMKPHAPSHVRGPFRPIRTNVPGLEICEHFPRMATMAQRFAIVRSVHHEEAAIHETGQQLLQTGRLAEGGIVFPHYGAVVSALRGRRYVLLPRPLGDTGVNMSHGQGAGFLGRSHEPFSPVAYAPGSPAFDLGKERGGLRDRYGRNPFGQSCLLARRLVERGVGVVSVNMFDTVFNTVTWDCHAAGGSLATTLDDYRATVCPMFDMAYAALLGDLDDRGLLTNTLVVAMGEFGRTPVLNSCGGRDHWPGVWSILFAGGGVRGGQVIGSSDSLAAEPRDRPVTPAEVAATIYQALGVNQNARVPMVDGTMVSLVNAAPVGELF